MSAASSGRRVVLVGKICKGNSTLQATLCAMGYNVLLSDSGEEYLVDEQVNEVVFVYDGWEDPCFDKLDRAGVQLIGPAVVEALAHRGEDLPYKLQRPLFSLSMRGLAVCFTGFREREPLQRMANQVHWLGGSIRKEVSQKVTHLVALNSGGDKYDKAFVLDVKVVSRDWVEEAWRRRNEPLLEAGKDIKVGFMRPFHGNTLSFFGFSEREAAHMGSVAENCGALVVQPGDVAATHLIINDLHVKCLPESLINKIRSGDGSEELAPQRHLIILKSEWFWMSVEMEMQVSDKEYRWKPAAESSVSTPGGTPGSTGRKRRREEVQRMLKELAGPDVFSPKGRGEDPTMMSMSPSFCDADNSNLSDSMLVIPLPVTIGASQTPPAHTVISPLAKTDNDAPSTPKSPKEKTTVTEKSSKRSQERELTLRYHKALELAQTERNYTKILHLIAVDAKKDLTEVKHGASGPILPPSDVHQIFSALPPVYELHSALSIALTSLVENWSDWNSSVGALYTQREEAFFRAYPPCLNFMEQIKSAILDAEHRNPRFHAYLKRFPSKPEAGRQSFADNLSRLFQRLPSKLLILRDMRKGTPDEHADATELDAAIRVLDRVLHHVNEDRMRTEGYVQMFDLFNDIEGCPPCLLSAHRELVLHVDVQELISSSDKSQTTAGHHLTLFLFKDCLEVTKRRRVAQSAKSPRGALARGTPSRSGSGAAAGNASTAVSGACPSSVGHPSGNSSQQPTMKHRDLVQLAFIRKVLDIRDPVCDEDDTRKIFGLVLRTPEAREKLHCFSLVNDDVEKNEFLMKLCRQVADAAFQNDAENLLIKIDPESLGIDPNMAFNKTKAIIRIGKRSARAVTRAFSFTRTPKQRLTRAVSNLAEPAAGGAGAGVAQNGACSPAESMDSVAMMEISGVGSQLDSQTPLHGGHSPSWSIRSEQRATAVAAAHAANVVSPPYGVGLSGSGVSTASLASNVPSGFNEQFTPAAAMDLDAFFGTESPLSPPSSASSGWQSASHLRRPQRLSIVKSLRTRVSRAFRRPTLGHGLSSGAAASTSALLMPPPNAAERMPPRRSLLRPGAARERAVQAATSLSKVQEDANMSPPRAPPPRKSTTESRLRKTISSFTMLRK